RWVPIEHAKAPKACAQGWPGSASTSTSLSRRYPTEFATACRWARSRMPRRPGQRRPSWPAHARWRRMSRPADLVRLSRVLIAEDELRARVAEIGEAIARDYARDSPGLAGVLKGALVFMADLIRVTPIELTTDFMVLSSYGGGSRSSGVVKLASDLSMPVEDRHVIIVEDIIDTGRTV